MLALSPIPLNTLIVLCQIFRRWKQRWTPFPNQICTVQQQRRKLVSSMLNFSLHLLSFCSLLTLPHYSYCHYTCGICAFCSSTAKPPLFAMSESTGLRTACEPLHQILQEPVASLNFSQYLQIIWADYTSISILALLTVGIWIAPMYYVECRVIPLWPSGSSIHDLRGPILLDYPQIPEPLPSWSCGFVIICVPLLIVSAFQIQTRRLWDLHTGVIGLLKAVLTTYDTPHALFPTP